MALWHCASCSTAYAVGLPACPHCRSTSKEEDGLVPKITKAGGPSHEGDPAPEPVVAEAEPVTAPVPVVAPEPEPEAKPRKRGKNVTIAHAQVAEGFGTANA